MLKVSYYRCSECGNLVELVNDGGGELVCCGQPMKLLEPNTVDAAQEKHVPVGTRNGSKLHVAVGSVPHPMTEEHLIQWVSVVQGNKIQRAALKPGDEPAAEFVIAEGPVEIYEYCNLHGLWKSEIV